jgi:hypothetical protein
LPGDGKLTRMQNKTLTYLHLPAGSALPDVKRLAPFLAIVLVEDEVADLWQFEACRWLVESGCRYALAWGKDCETWREAIEDAALEAFDYEDVPEESRVLSTAHEDEDLEEVFWFARHRAAHPVLGLNATAIVHIAAAPRKDEIEAAYHAA